MLLSKQIAGVKTFTKQLEKIDNRMESNVQMLLTEPQLELLKMFAHKVDNADWIAIKKIIVDYFAQKAIEGADKLWDERGWDEQKMNELLNTHLRTPYKPANL